MRVAANRLYRGGSGTCGPPPASPVSSSVIVEMLTLASRSPSFSRSFRSPKKALLTNVQRRVKILVSIRGTGPSRTCTLRTSRRLLRSTVCDHSGPRFHWRWRHWRSSLAELIQRPVSSRHHRNERSHRVVLHFFAFEPPVLQQEHVFRRPFAAFSHTLEPPMDQHVNMWPMEYQTTGSASMLKVT